MDELGQIGEHRVGRVSIEQVRTAQQHGLRSRFGSGVRPGRSRFTRRGQGITATTQTPIYLCEPWRPRQRSTNEDTDQLLRRYLPKRADLRRFGQADLDTIACELNHRPNKIHGYRSPAEVYLSI